MRQAKFDRSLNVIVFVDLEIDLNISVLSFDSFSVNICVVITFVRCLQWPLNSNGRWKFRYGGSRNTAKNTEIIDKLCNIYTPLFHVQQCPNYQFQFIQHRHTFCSFRKNTGAKLIFLLFASINTSQEYWNFTERGRRKKITTKNIRDLCGFNDFDNNNGKNTHTQRHARTLEKLHKNIQNYKTFARKIHNFCTNGCCYWYFLFLLG